MTAQILASELSTIISESKRKNAELRTIAEKSAQELKALPQTSEAQVAADLRRRPHFPSPFFAACRSSSGKLVLSGVIGLQRLIVSQGLAAERLRDALDALQECCKNGLDVQLKVLQSLPSLIQNYSDALEGDLQAKVFDICTILQQVKSASVSSTASATLQQVVSTIFEKVEKEDDRAAEVPSVTEINTGDGTVRLRSAACDAYRVLNDICILLEGQKAEFTRATTLSQPFGLELIEAILTNNGELFDTHDELAHLLRLKVMPLVTRFLSERPTFALTVRTTRILCIIVREHIEITTDETEIALGLLGHMLDADGPNQWRRALCMETYRIIYSIPGLAVTLYALFDQEEGRRNIVQESLALFVRLAAEKPALIGLGNQSSFPAVTQTAKTASQEQAVLEANSVAGVISGDLGVTETNAPGIGAHSAMRPPCLEQLDKVEPPPIPETYIYSLVLASLTALSDGLAKFILPLTVPQLARNDTAETTSAADGDDSPATPSDVRPRSRTASNAQDFRIPVNPLDLKNHKRYTRIRSIAAMVEDCWPAILATSSTFLNAALDADHYRGLIRSVQRFTQLAGLLRLTTPRDAFMTTLAKSAVPAHLLQETGSPLSAGMMSPRLNSVSDGFFNAVSADSPKTRSHSRRSSVDTLAPASMSQRNLMCLRALVNIAIAIGSILGTSWSIIMDALQKADNVLAQSGNALARDYRASTAGIDAHGEDPAQEQASLVNEVAAVEAAINRLFTSTGDYPDESFNFVLRSLCTLLGEQRGGPTARLPGTPMVPRRVSSLQTVSASSGSQTRTLHFALAKLSDLARTNIMRLCQQTDSEGWDPLTAALTQTATDLHLDSTARLMAADILASVALGVTLATLASDATTRERIQLRALGCLEGEASVLLEKIRQTHSIPSGTDMDIHRSSIESVRSVLENCGESLVAGWRSIFAVVNSAFTSTRGAFEEEDDDSIDGSDADVGPAVNRPRAQHPISPRIARAAFDCVQLICSDFLSSLKRSRVVLLIDILSQFCLQTADINISLTTLTLFWNLSDYLQNEIQPNGGGGDSHAMDEIREAAEQGSLPATWMFLQHSLASMTEDARTDVRIGALQTTFRILGSSVDRLGQKVFVYSFEHVLLRMLKINLDKCSETAKESATSRSSLQSASRTLLDSLADYLAAHKEAIVELGQDNKLWRGMLEALFAHIRAGDRAMQSIVFDTLSKTTMLDVSDPITLATAGSTLGIWFECMPHGLNAPSDPDVHDKALTSYTRFGRVVYPLLQSRLNDDQVQQISDNLMGVLDASTISPYSSDLDSMTAMQDEVMHFMSLLKTTSARVSSHLLMQMARLVTLPYRGASRTSSMPRPSFVALSKRAMTEAQRLAVDKASEPDVYQSGGIIAVIDALSSAIAHRYSHPRQGAHPPMWKVAAIVASAIIKAVLPLHRLDLLRETRNRVWIAIIRLTCSLRESQWNILPSDQTLLSDESFDLERLSEIRQCMSITLARDEETQQACSTELDSADVGEDNRKSYVASLFQASLFHERDYQIPSDLLDGLHKIRAGRVYDPPFCPRIRICYASLDELFAIVLAGHSYGEGNGPALLRQTAKSYLILRSALPLKRYIADQPLRGKMPTPTSQRLELLYVLKKLKAIPFDELVQLLPLVGKASICASTDRDMTEALQDVLACSYTR